MQCQVMAVGRPSPTVTLVLSHAKGETTPGLHVGHVEAALDQPAPQLSRAPTG